MKGSFIGDFASESCIYWVFNHCGASDFLYNVVMTGRERIGSRYYIERSDYDNYLLSYVEEGTAVMEYEGNRYDLRAGDLVMIDCAARHVFYPTGNVWRIAYVHATGVNLATFYAQFRTRYGNVCHGYDGTAYLAHVDALHACIRAIGNGIVVDQPYTRIYDVYDTVAAARLSEAFYRIMLDVNELLYDRPNDPLAPVRAAIRYMEDNFDRKLTLEEIAASAGYSKYYFERLFKQVANATVLQYLNRIRYQRARALLSLSRLTVTQIATACGFSDTQMLNRLFKQYEGISPVMYRRALRDEK